MSDTPASNNEVLTFLQCCSTNPIVFMPSPGGRDPVVTDLWLARTASRPLRPASAFERVDRGIDRGSPRMPCLPSCRRRSPAVPLRIRGPYVRRELAERGSACKRDVRSGHEPLAAEIIAEPGEDRYRDDRCKQIDACDPGVVMWLRMAALTTPHARPSFSSTSRAR